MTENPDDVLNEHYLFLVDFVTTFYTYLSNERDKKLADQWMRKICSEKVQGISQKRNRNSFLAYFVMNLQEGKLTGPFSKPPDDGPLPLAKDIFGHVEKAESISSKDEESLDASSEDFVETSADGRTYVAIRCLPEDRGIYAVVGLNIDNEDDNAKDIMIVPCRVDRSKLRHIRTMHEISKSNSLGSHPSESQMEDFYMRNIESKISGDISQLYKTLNFAPGQPCGRDPMEVAYYDVLLDQIDEEIKGEVTSENELVRFLVNRLAQDLKKLSKMKHIFELAPDQQNLELLRILRQKLVVRQQEEKRRNLLAEMEEQIFCSQARTECCIGRLDITTESMWQLAVTRPLADSDYKKLSDVYPEDAIGTFLDLLADDRSVILDRGKKRQKKCLASLRSEVYREIHSCKAEYNKARADYREWNEILSIIEEMMYEAGNEIVEDGIEHVERRTNDTVLVSMIANIKETKNLVIEEAHRAEMLTERIADANTWKFSNDDQGTDSSWEIKSEIENMRREIESCRLVIRKQNQRIQELRAQIEFA